MKKLPMLQSPFLLVPGLPYLALVSFLIQWVFPVSEQQSGSEGTPQSLGGNLFLQILAMASFHSSALLAPSLPCVLVGVSGYLAIGCGSSAVWKQLSVSFSATLIPHMFSLPPIAQPAAAGGFPSGQHLLQAGLLAVLPRRKVLTLPAV